MMLENSWPVDNMIFSNKIWYAIMFDGILIQTANDLYNMRNDLNAKYLILNDIDMITCNINNCNTNFISIGNFSGTLNGNGKIISNFKVSKSIIDEVVQSGGGLMDSLGTNGKVENISFVNVDIFLQYGGVIAAHVYGKIERVYLSGSLRSSSTGRLGGVTGSLSTGGLISEIVSNLEFGSADISAGLVNHFYGGTIQNSIVTTDIISDQYGGGIFGYGYGGSCSVSNVLYTGTATRDPFPGNSMYPHAFGPIGGNIGAILNNAFFSTSRAHLVANVIGIGFTDEELRQSSTYIGWNTNIWNIFDGEFPTLKNVVYP